MERDILYGLSAKQFRGWELFAELEPFEFHTELRADYRTASITQMIANVNRDSRKPAYKLADCMLKFEKDSGSEEPVQKRQTWQEQLNLLTVWARVHNAHVTEQKAAA